MKSKMVIFVLIFSMICIRIYSISTSYQDNILSYNALTIQPMDENKTEKMLKVENPEKNTENDENNAEHLTVENRLDEKIYDPVAKIYITLDQFNQYTEEEVMHLRGIGPKIAHEIILFRAKNGPFISFEHLMDVKGIGEKKLETILNEKE